MEEFRNEYNYVIYNTKHYEMNTIMHNTIQSITNEKFISDIRRLYTKRSKNFHKFIKHTSIIGK